MLASNYLLKSKEIERAKVNAKLIQSQDFGVFVSQRQNDSFPRFAFVISTKISKLAVHRNRVKRALSEAIRINLNKVPKTYNFVFLAKKSIVSKTTEEIMKETQDFLTNLSNLL